MIIPGILLALLAVRAINREEAFIEKRLEDTLMLEITHVVTLVNTELQRIEEELLSASPVIKEDGWEDDWKRSSSLIGVPFLLSAGNRILMPEAGGALPDNELSFLEQKRDYSRPFAAREISEYLPLWEAAVYLTDPDIISSRVNFVTTIMWILIVILFASIIGGGVLVLKTLNSEIVLARQKTAFVANVSHELKTPLTSIRMFAEMLKQGKQPDKEKQARYFDIMVSETERLTRLINNILDFSRMDSGKKHYNKKRVDISRLCFKLVESEHIRAEQNGFKISFKSTVKDSKKGIAYADEEAIKQALLNLLSNAEKYSDKEKDINVETGQENNFLYIEVEDRGRGIPPRHVKKIFNEFYRIDDSLTSRVKGTGLGLSIARRIIRDHGGDIKCFPRDGGGSVFRIKLPVIS